LKKEGTIVGLVIGFRDDTARREAERVVLESEERFRLMADTAPVMIWMTGEDAGRDYFNRSWFAFTGRSLDAQAGSGWTEGVHPDDLESCMSTYLEAFSRREAFRMEYRLRRHDGEYRWVVDNGVPIFHPDGAAGYIGSAIDVTDDRLAQEALSNLSRRLMQAQEEERTFIARELHDDLGQRAVALAVQLQALAQSMPADARELTRLQQILDQAVTLAQAIPAVSHRLHSATVHLLGIAPTAGRLCKELSDLYQVQIDFHHERVPTNINEDVAICLLRVLQEALHNAIKHAGVRHLVVELRGTSSEIELKVIDRGRGFDPKEAGKKRGLGLVSMRERLNLVHGALSVQSRLGAGTTIHARVPLVSGEIVTVEA
jgi:PAS domain S-box-containing protein